MITHINWLGSWLASQEECRVTASPQGNIIDASTNGIYNGNPYAVNYHIETGRDWDTRTLQLNRLFGDAQTQLSLSGNGKRSWMINGSPAPYADGCIDIDISVTPFTNTLPIRRLGLKPGQSAVIDVLYIDIEKNTASKLQQRYTCLNLNSYRYDNLINDFTSVIQVNAEGFVVDYPGLFQMTRMDHSDS